MVRPKSHPKVFEAQRAASSWDTASPARGRSKAFTACATTHRSAEPERCWRLPHGVKTRAPGVPGEGLSASRYRTAMAAYCGKPLKLINHPVREGILVPLAALGPKNVERAAALAEGWQPIFFLPERAESV